VPLVVTLLVLAMTAFAAATPSPTKALSMFATRCDGVSLRTKPSTSSTKVTALAKGIRVVAVAKVSGGSWKTACAGVSSSGSSWYRISIVNNRTVSSRYGLSYVYAASSLLRKLYSMSYRQAACDGVAVRTSTSTGSTKKAGLPSGTKVTVSALVSGGKWSTSCTGNAVTGTSWYRIKEINGRSVSSLYGVSSVYAAKGHLASWTATPAPAATWFGGSDPWAGMAFGSFPNAPAGQMWISGDQGGRTISRLTFRNRPAGQNVLVLDGVSNLKIDLIDFDTVPEGIYIRNSHDVEIGRIRARNIFGPFTRTTFHSGNLIQAVNSKRLHIHDLKLDQPESVPAGYTAYGTEDIISLGGDPGAWGGDSWSAPFLVERFAIDGGAWQSSSGTGIFVGDGDSGKYVWIRDGILINPGQVGIGTGTAGPYRFEDIQIKATRGNDGIQLRTNRAEFGGMRVQWPGRALNTDGHTYTTTAPNDWDAVLDVHVAL